MRYQDARVYVEYGFAQAGDRGQVGPIVDLKGGKILLTSGRRRSSSSLPRPGCRRRRRESARVLTTLGQTMAASTLLPRSATRIRRRIATTN
jgi:hypothetical protein